MSGRLEILSPQGDLEAWAVRWAVDRPVHHGMLAIPRLHLSYDTALDLCAGQSYSTVFTGSQVHFEGQALNLHVIHSTFPLWKDGRADLDKVAFILLDGTQTLDMKKIGQAAKKGREMLEKLVHGSEV